jgi:hypothetical protein
MNAAKIQGEKDKNQDPSDKIRRYGKPDVESIFLRLVFPYKTRWVAQLP